LNGSFFALFVHLLTRGAASGRAYFLLLVRAIKAANPVPDRCTIIN